MHGQARAAGAEALEVVGDARRDLVAVERIAGRPDHARDALERALAAYERKGVAPMVTRTRGELTLTTTG